MANPDNRSPDIPNESNVLQVVWRSGIEILDLNDVFHAAKAAEPATITTREIRTDDVIVQYQPTLTMLSGKKRGFALSYDHPGVWLSGDHIGENADGDLGVATYTHLPGDDGKEEKWTCSWHGRNGRNARPTCKLSARDTSRVYKTYERAVRDGAFRTLLLQHTQCCAISGETLVCVLDAAHILPVSDNGSDDLTNGMVLRKDLHALFDAGYISIREDGRFILEANLPQYAQLIEKAEPLAAIQVPAVLKNVIARNALKIKTK